MRDNLQKLHHIQPAKNCMITQKKIIFVFDVSVSNLITHYATNIKHHTTTLFSGNGRYSRFSFLSSFVKYLVSTLAIGKFLCQKCKTRPVGAYASIMQIGKDIFHFGLKHGKCQKYTPTSIFKIVNMINELKTCTKLWFS